MARKKGRKNKKFSLLGILCRVAVFCLCGYCVVTLISQQLTIYEKKKEINEINTQIIIEKQNVDDFNRLLSLTDEKSFMEKIAIERLGYAYPNEKRYFDISKY